MYIHTYLTVHKEIYRAEKCKYNTLLLDDIKIIDDLFFRHKTTKLAAYCSAQDLATRFATLFKKKLTKLEMSYLIALTST